MTYQPEYKRILEHIKGLGITEKISELETELRFGHNNTKYISGELSPIEYLQFLEDCLQYDDWHYNDGTQGGYFQ